MTRRWGQSIIRMNERHRFRVGIAAQNFDQALRADAIHAQEWSDLRLLGKLLLIHVKAPQDFTPTIAALSS
jgi:hypothetical protein